ncbi:MAG: hypothetical protein ACLQGT_04475 [Terracidiphilus sp.]
MTTTASATEPIHWPLLLRANQLFNCQREPLHTVLAGWLKEHYL